MFHIQFFYRDAQKWVKDYPDVSINTRKTRAKHIVNIYIRHNAVCAINVPSAVSKTLLAAIEQQIDPPPTFFDVAVNEIRELLEGGALMRFKLNDVESEKQLSFKV